jgi:hypothetical protein
MTEAVNQNQRSGVLVPTILGAGAGVGGYFAADRANFGIPSKVDSWEEAVARATDKDEFVSKKIEKAAEGDEKNAWKALQEKVKGVKDADAAIKDIVAEGTEDYSDDLAKYFKAVDDKAAAEKALKAGEVLDSKLDDAVKSAREALEKKVKLKDSKTIDEFTEAVARKNKLFADKGDDVAKQLSHIKFANKWLNVVLFAAGGLLAGLGINALVKNKE